MIKSEAPIVIDAVDARAALDFKHLIPALRRAFSSVAIVPSRHHHVITQEDGSESVLLLMPAWGKRYLGVKVVSVHPGNTARGEPGLYSSYLLSDRETGRPLAMIDGNQITAHRTVGVAALAASFLAREDASSLLVVGAGRVASLAADAFLHVRPIRKVAIWDVNNKMAGRLAHELRSKGVQASVAPSLEEAVREADIISCATLSTSPLIKGEWVQPGTHLDLIGSFTREMREADEICMARGLIYVDTEDALNETGDLIIPLEQGIIRRADIRGTLASLCRADLPGRASADEFTIFKAVGTALADIAAGALVYELIK